MIFELVLPWTSVLWLVFAAFCASFIDSIAGGGGLITMPALLLAGLPPVTAMATNKLQSSFGVAAATLTFARAGKLDRALLLPLFGTALVGGGCGAAMAHLAPLALLRAVVPLILIIIAIFVLFSPQLSDEDAHPRLNIRQFLACFGFGIAFYDGIFGPGTGTFFMLAFVLMAGFGSLRAVAHTKLMNLGSNLGALAFFIAAGHVILPLGLLMAMGSIAGGWLGAHTGLRYGVRLIRPLVVTLSIFMAIRLLIDPTNPIHGFFMAFLAK